MSNDSMWLIMILMLVLVLTSLVLVYDKWKYSCSIREITSILEDIVKGNRNRKIYVSSKNALAPLVFEINKLVESYQKDKIEEVRVQQARKRMLSNLSHDVRTPLTSVLGYLDALCQGIAGEEAEEYLHIAKSKAYELKEYIEELFTVAQIDAEEISLEFENLDLCELLRSELIGWIPQLQKENIILEAKIPDEEYWVMVDRHALIRIFNNLLKNALTYGGGSNFLGVTAWAEENYVNFQVWDKGPGLSELEATRVFERLYKGDSSRSTKGHGLGLSIAKELVTKMKGSIFLESTPYVKTFVQVSLPKSKK